MKIKNKTVLRKWIKNSIGTTGELKIIWFFDDGTWQVTDQNTMIPDTFGYKVRSLLTPLSREFEGQKNLDKLITRHLEQIEKGITETLKRELYNYRKDLEKAKQAHLYSEQAILATIETKIKELEKNIKE